MNQTKQEAAEAIFQEQISGYPESNRGDMMYGFDYGFQAGTKAAALKWIPVTERLPEIGQQVIIRCVKVELHFDLVYFDGSFHTKHITHWCPIPDSLLNFKP